MKVSGFTSSIQIVFVAVTLFLLALPVVSNAQSTNECSFGQTLDIGVVDESVRCLQVYLNNNGFVLATLSRAKLSKR